MPRMCCACVQEFEAAGGKLPPGLWEEILGGLKEVEEAYGAKFADPVDPLLVSVRSGAAVSMPGEQGRGRGFWGWPAGIRTCHSVCWRDKSGRSLGRLQGLC
jgi:hypothetical protein